MIQEEAPFLDPSRVNANVCRKLVAKVGHNRFVSIVIMSWSRQPAKRERYQAGMVSCPTKMLSLGSPDGFFPPAAPGSSADV